MSRRVRSGGFGDEARGRSRMAPGGRMWSERPVPRVAVRRVPIMEGPPPTGYYASFAETGSSGLWYSVFWPLDTGAPGWAGQPAEGWYDLTYYFQLTAVHPTATSITMFVTPHNGWTNGDEYILTGGPFSVGQVISFTVLGHIDPSSWSDVSFHRVASSGPNEWSTGVTTDYYTAVPADPPVGFMAKERPPDLREVGNHGRE